MKKNLRVEEVGDELIIWDDELLQADVLGRFETRVYKLAAEGMTVDEIEAALRSSLKIPPEHDVRTALTEILEDFVRHGLIDPDPLQL